MDIGTTHGSLLLPVPPHGAERPVPTPGTHTMPRLTPAITYTIAALYALIVCFTALASASAVATTTTARPHVDPSVHRALRAHGSVDLIVTLASDRGASFAAVRSLDLESRSAKLDALRTQLEAHSAASAFELEQTLRSADNNNSERSTDDPVLHAGYKRFWISNQVLVSAASRELVEQLAALGSVQSIRPQARVTLDVLQHSTHRERTATDDDDASVAADNDDSDDTSDPIAWGVRKIDAPRVWADGVTGTGVIVANIDGGVRRTHDALQANYRQTYGWFDPEAHSTEPFDTTGHGTHTMGSIAGTHGIGVAPSATWIACRGCRDEDCPDSDLLACAQWIVCPTDTNGDHPDCSMAPHIVSNSWSTTGGNDWFQTAVDVWVAAGILPVFSGGNLGPDCSTIGSPGDYANVICVGATNQTDGLAAFSSRGPSAYDTIKPDIVAPGFEIRSAHHTSDDAFVEMSGASMATPYVAGAIALLLSAQPSLTIHEVKAALAKSAVTTVLAPSGSAVCGDTPDSAWPNNQFGHGRLNAWELYERFASPRNGDSPLARIHSNTGGNSSSSE